MAANIDRQQPASNVRRDSPHEYSPDVAESDDVDWLRQRLVAIEDEIRATPPDELQTRFELATAGDQCRAMLRAGSADAVAAAREAWTARAANKGTHEQNVAVLEAIARFMPGEGGGPG